MEQGGTLTIVVAPATTGAKQGVVVEVRDAGKGIKPEDLSKVMEPFFTSKPVGKGTGLGLPICRRIVAEHKGAMELTSELGRGTTVRVFRPCTNGTNSEHLQGKGP